MEKPIKVHLELVYLTERIFGAECVRTITAKQRLGLTLLNTDSKRGLTILNEVVPVVEHWCSADADLSPESLSYHHMYGILLRKLSNSTPQRIYEDQRRILEGMMGKFPSGHPAITHQRVHTGWAALPAKDFRFAKTTF